jgi:hypothetical protein
LDNLQPPLLFAGTLSQWLTKVDAAIDNLISQRLVCPEGDVVVDKSVRGHFDTSLGPSPIFRRRSQCLADTLVPKFFLDKPSFDKADRVFRIAAVCVRTQTHLEKARQVIASAVKGNKDGGRQSSASAGSKHRFDLDFMFRGWRIGPQQLAHR